ncbi:MAG: hypothetical protein Q9217_001706 [Psora testacea]
MQSLSSSSEEEFEDAHEGQRQGQNPKPQSQLTGSDSLPIQKRRRVTRACDECRKKKIKCDGKQPCTHCSVYSYECTYDQPSNRRRNPTPQYVEALEMKLQRAETILKSVMPEVNLDGPVLDMSIPQQADPAVKQQAPQAVSGQRRPWTKGRTPPEGSYGEKDSMLESMVQNTGSLDLDDEGYWDFHGHSSGRAFLRKLREQLGDLMGKPDTSNGPFIKSRSGSHPGSSPASTAQSPMGSKMPNTDELPPKSSAMLLCRNALDDACAILRFVHQPTFYAMFDQVYDNPSENLGTQGLKFLPLLYAVIALGSLFATAEQSELMINGFENATEQG